MFGKNGRVFGWPESGFPAQQGPFYCGVGLEETYGRPLAEAHMDACMKAGLMIAGINAEARRAVLPLLHLPRSRLAAARAWAMPQVMPGQWEFQIGPTSTLETGDQVQMARWLLHRLGEDFGIAASLAVRVTRCSVCHCALAHK